MNYRNLLIGLLVILSGCALFGGQKDVYTDSAPYHQPEQKIWDAIHEVLRDYSILNEDRLAGTIETTWFDEIIGVGRYESSRKKLYLKLVRPPDKKAASSGSAKTGGYVVQIMVKVQHNKNLPAYPAPESMQWDDAGFDDTVPQVIFWKLDRRLQPRINTKNSPK